MNNGLATRRSVVRGAVAARCRLSGGPEVGLSVPDPRYGVRDLPRGTPREGDDAPTTKTGCSGPERAN